MNETKEMIEEAFKDYDENFKTLIHEMQLLTGFCKGILTKKQEKEFEEFKKKNNIKTIVCLKNNET